MFYRQKTYISFSVLAVLLQASYACAQSGTISPDSTYHLDGLTLEASSMPKVILDHTIDSSALVLDNAIGIGGLLKYNSLIFIKDYGPGNMSSVSARGGSAVQSQVFWNGININQAGLGMTDLSTLPSFLLDNITIQQSASGAASGSGSVAGNVSLSNSNTSNVGLYGLIKQTFSSIGERSTGIRLGYNKGKLFTDVRYFYLDSDNHYQFTNTAARPYAKEETQQNASLLQHGYSSTVKYEFSPHTELLVYSWYTHFDRNITPTLQTITKSKQRDVSFKNSIQLNHKGEKSQWSYKLAYLRDAYTYTQRSAYSDSIIDYTKGHADNLVNQYDYSYQLTQRIKLSAGVSDIYQSVINSKYEEGGKSRNRLSLYGGAIWIGEKKHTSFTALVRQEWYASQHSPLIYSLQWDQRITRGVSFLIKGERQYRIPTMNDLYWGQVGNINLKPEQGWGTEASVNYVLKYGKVKNSCIVTVFSRSVKDWILYTPAGRENPNWMPQNINHVWSRGIEFRNDFSIQVTQHFFATFSFKHTYQRSTQQDHSDRGGNAYHKQLIYTPIYLGNAGLVIQYKQFALSYFQQYTSWVFLINDESDFIDPYTYAMIRLQGGFTFGKNKADLFVEADNCWNNTYQTVKDRPMPLRYFRAGVIYKWN